MSKTNRSSAKALSATAERAETDSTSVNRDNENRSKSRRNGRSRGRSRTDMRSQNAENSTLSRMTQSRPSGSAAPSILFPTDSMSALNLGTFISKPGFDNFVERGSQVTTRVNGSQRPGPNFHVSANARAKFTPSAMCLSIIPTFGATGRVATFQATSPLSLAGLNLKQYIDLSYGTVNSYDPQDIMLYLMAVAAVFPVIAELKRDLRLAFTASDYPNFLPYGMIQCLGITSHGSNVPEEVASDIALNYRNYVDTLNQLIQTFNGLPKPPEILAFGYNDDLFSAIFTDTDDVETAQQFVFRNAGGWVYNEDADENCVGLDFIEFSANYTSIDAKLNFLRSQIQAISALRSSSNVMLQNMYNAYGSKDTIQIPLMDVDFPSGLPLEYNERMLMSIENCVICGSQLQTASYYSEPVHNGITGGPYYLASDYSSFPQDAVINLPLQFHKDASAVTHDDIGAALRFHPLFNYFEFASIKSSIGRDSVAMPALHSWDYMGMGLITTLTVTRRKVDGAWQTSSINHRRMNSYLDIALLQDFAHAPMLTIVSTNGSWSDTDIEVVLDEYTGARDLEVNYRVEDAKMFWTYLTQNVWGANVNRNSQGSRK